MELCIDFGGTEVKLAAIADGRVRASRSLPVGGTPADLDATADAVREMLAQDGLRADVVGIAVPGVVDPSTGRMLQANAKYDYLRGADLDAWSRAEFELPAAVENDARAALIGETSTGSAAGEQDAVLVTLGTGIGTAAMIGGVPLRGRSGHAGILGGHMTVELDGPVCPCGNVGCGEELASAHALRTREHVDMRELFAGDAHRALRARTLRVWGAVVTSLVHAYDPAVVILSGGVMRAGAAVQGPVEEFVRAHAWSSLPRPRFVVPTEPELSVARGLSVVARREHIHHDQEEL